MSDGVQSKRLAMFDAMIAKGSDDPFVHYARAMEFRSLSALAEALEAFGGVAERFPDYVPTYLMAAQVAAELEDIPVAVGWCERGLEKAKNDAHAHSELSAFLDEID